MRRIVRSFKDPSYIFFLWVPWNRQGTIWDIIQTFTDSIPLVQKKLLERLAKDYILQGPHKKNPEEYESMHLDEKNYSQIISYNL